ncbi:MAG: glycosyltransferase family 39 protein [Anaerolineae bacterium]
MRSTRRWELAAICLLVLLALVLRFYRLDAQSLWNDEGTSVALAQRDLVTITRSAAADIHPPFYYYMLHAWVRLAGVSEVGVRSLSALAGGLLVLCTYLLGRRYLGVAAALLGAALSALSAFQLYYSQEARMYGVATLFGLLSMLAFERLLSRDLQAQQKRWPLGAMGLYVVASSLALYSHYYAATVLLAQNVALVAWLALGRGRGKPSWQAVSVVLVRWAALQAVVALVYAPWLAFSWRSLRSWPAVSEALTLRFLLADAARLFSYGVTVAAGPRLTWLALALALPALLPLAVTFWRGRGEPAATGVRAENQRSALVLILYLAVPLLAMYVLSLQRPMYKSKFLLLATPAFYLLQAKGLWLLGKGLERLTRSHLAGKLASGLAIVLVCATSGWALGRAYTDPTFYRDDYRGIVAAINATALPTDAILINAPSQIETVDYYYRGPLSEYPLPLQRPMDREQTQAALEDIAEHHTKVYAIFWATGESDPERFVEGWLDQHCFKARDDWFGNVRLAVYAVPRAPATEIEYPLDVVLGERVRLRGYTLLTPEARSGDILQLTLFWEAIAFLPERYKVFTHLVDAQGTIVGQRDAEPGGGTRLTTNWEPGELIADNYGIPIPADVPMGALQLRVGMYSLATGQRLPVEVSGRPGGDAVELGSVAVQAAVLPTAAD